MLLLDILTVLDSIAPFNTAEQWDNVGLMVGDPRQEVSSVLLALDPSYEVIDAAAESGKGLIITHHPLIYTPLKRIDFREPVSRKISALIRASVALISMHTNFDIASGGVSDVLARKLGLGDVQSSGPLRLGTIAGEKPLRAWAMSLPFETVRIVDAGRPVRNICICPGSGMEYVKTALETGCDTFVTGDVKYHGALDAKESGINIIDLGHFATEQIAITPLAERLSRELPDISIDVFGAQDVFTNIKGEQN